MTNNRCKHCGNNALSGDDFCCNGCKAAWDMLHSLGLEDYYSRKGGVITSKAPENIFIAEEFFDHCVKKEQPDRTTAFFYITSVRCAACVWLVENIIKKMDGVTDARVNYATYRVKVTFDPSKISLKLILEQIAKAGYPPTPENPIQSDKEKRGTFIRFAVGAFFTMQLMLYSIAIYAGYFQDMSPQIKQIMQFVSWFLTTPVVFYTGSPFFINAYSALKNKHLSMDVLVALGAGSAYLYSIAAMFTGYEVYFDTAATILTLITLGRYIEIAAKQRTKSGLLSLFSLSAPFARLVTDNGYVMVPLSGVREGEKVQVLAGDKIPVDGTILSGAANIDESMLTGEPIPKGKKEGDDVYAGTVNTDGQFTMLTKSVGNNTVLAQIIKAIESADVSRTKLINTVDKITSVFIPAVLLIAFGTLISHLINGAEAGKAIMTAVSVLVVACPCALGLAVPLAVTVAVGRSSHFNAIIKNGDVFENIAKCRKICFDKTGVLTLGTPTVISINTNMDQSVFQQMSVAVESHSKHILAGAIINAYPEYIETAVAEFTETAGHGLSAMVDGIKIVIGRYSFVSPFINEPEPELYAQMLKDSSEGYTTVPAVIGGRFAGYYVISDPLRKDAVETIGRLRNNYKITLLSGDSEPVVQKIAKSLKVDFLAELSPFDKVNAVESYMDKNSTVMMVGDGINDAPALMTADIGVAVGRNLADVTIDSADVILTKPNLEILENLIKLSKRTKCIVRENLAWAFAYNIAAIPLAAAGLLHPILSAIFMSVSSIIVVLNSLRIVR